MSDSLLWKRLTDQHLSSIISFSPSPAALSVIFSSTVGIFQASTFAKQQNLCVHWFRLANPPPPVLCDLFLLVLVVVWVAPEESGLKCIAATIWWTRLLANTAALPNNQRCSENIPLVGVGEAAVKLTVIDEHGVELEDASLHIACHGHRLTIGQLLCLSCQ